MTPAALDRQLHQARARGDAATLARLYAEVARHAPRGEARFWLTQAWICALEAGVAQAATLRARLEALDGAAAG